MADWCSSRINDVSATIAALKVCTNLDRGKMLHADAIDGGNHGHPHVAAALVSMYMRCGGIADARTVFDAMPRRNAVAWNALIQGFGDNGREDWAIDAFYQMEEEIMPNPRSFVAVLKACAKFSSKDREQALEKGMELHAQAAARGFDRNEFVANSLIDLYVKCGSMADASRVFFSMPVRSAVSWTSLILGFAENREEETALELFQIMLDRERECRPDGLTFVAALKACARLASREESTLVGTRLVKATSLERGRIIHSRARRSGCELTIVLESALVDMYAKCRDMVDARRVFGSMECRNIVSWNALILGYAENGEEELALETFSRINAEEEGSCKPDDRTFVAALKACAGLAAKETGKHVDDLPKLVKLDALEQGMSIHAQLENSIPDPDVYVMNTLVDMYARCRSMPDSQRAFDQTSHHSTVSWNALILGYAENGQGDAALEFFEYMLAAGECQPDALTYVAAIKACSTMTTTEKDKVSVDGKLVNTRSLETRFAIHAQAGAKLVDELLLANTLLDAYASSGSTVDARSLFDRMEFHSLVSWNVLMHAYADDEQGDEVLELFARMKREATCRPDCRTFTALLKACGSGAALSTGRAVQGEIHRAGFGDDPVIVTVIVEMFGKCGSMIDAQHISDSSPQSSETIAALAAGYSRRGDVIRVLGLYHQMRDEGVKISSSCFVSILVACSHGGLVETSKEIFRAMEDLGVLPGMEHYVCMVDVLGRANQLEEAIKKRSEESPSTD